MSRLLSERGAARYLGVTPLEMYRLRCEGLVPAQQVTIQRAVFDVDDLDRYAEAIGRQRTYKFKHETVTVIYDEENR